MSSPHGSDSTNVGLDTLLRGEAGAIAAWIERWSFRCAQKPVLTIIIGTGAFGAAMGSWRDPLQAVYAGAKLPLILLLTAAGNALINGMLAPLLGLGLTMRQSFAAVVTSFTIAGLILGAFSPLMAFLVWNLPPLEHAAEITPTVHGLMLVTLFVMIAIAGVTANLRLFQLLRTLGGDQRSARRILFAWLAVNLLLGSQLSWILRPFVGAPGLEVAFLRPDAFHGSFFETLFAAARGLFP